MHDEVEPPRRPATSGDMARAIAKGTLIYGLGVGLVLLISMSVEREALFFIGGTQMLFVLPALVVLHVRKQTETAYVVAIYAAVLFLLSSICFGLWTFG